MEQPQARNQWASQVGFVLAAVGSAIGLGNIWRFPYLAYKHGGAAFLVPYALALFVVGIPLMILEMGLGHHMKASAPLAFRRIDRRFGWIGWWAVTFVMFGIVVYYAVVIAWCLCYFVLAFGRFWGEEPGKFFAGSFLMLTPQPAPGASFQWGGLAWWVLIALAAVWLLNWLITFTDLNRGIERANRIFIPVLVGLTAVLVFWALTFPGAKDGLRMYLGEADWRKLADPTVWTDAFGQIFFTLSLGFGIMIAYASYLPANANIPVNALVTSIGNCSYSLFAGIAVFSTIGFVAHSYQADVKKLEQTLVVRAAENEAGKALLAALPEAARAQLAKGIASDKLPALLAQSEQLPAAYGEGLLEESLALGGPGLVFNTYPVTLNMIPGGSVFGVLFFLALVVAGITSSMSIIEAFSSAVTDNFGVSRRVTASVLCAAAFLLGIPFATGSGMWLLDVVDRHLNTYALMVVGILESIIVGWYFTARRLRGHIDEAAGLRLAASGDRLMRVVLTALLALTWYGLARTGEQTAGGISFEPGTTVAMLILLGTIVMVWMDEHWLDFDVKVVIPVLLTFILNRTLAADVASGHFYGGYSGSFVAVGVGWLFVTLLLAFVLEEVSSRRRAIAGHVGRLLAWLKRSSQADEKNGQAKDA